MNFERMWFLLKRTVKEDYDIFSNKSRLGSYSELHKGIASEAQDIIHRMDELEEQRGAQL